MATLEVRLRDLATDIATKIKATRILLNNNAADLAALTTTAKTNVVAAINEVRALAAGKADPLGFTPIDAATKAQANGVASLDGSGKVPSSQLPGFVDDVLEYANLAAFPGAGTAGILYVAADSNLSYRWSGSGYVAIVGSPGTTDAVPEGATNLYHTAGRAKAALDPYLGETDTNFVAVFQAGLV